jgi:hypothetical protein
MEWINKMSQILEKAKKHQAKTQEIFSWNNRVFKRG